LASLINFIFTKTFVVIIIVVVVNFIIEFNIQAIFIIEEFIE
jgi:hypothetical protein